MDHTEIRVECPWCGTQTLPPNALRCSPPAETGKAGLCEFTCPLCSRLVLVPATPEGVAAARAVGVDELSGSVPWELLEDRSGPPLSWDDLLDLRLSIERTCCPQAELLG